MPQFAHLPEAVARCAGVDLRDLDDIALRLMVDECEAWQAKTEHFRAQIGSRSTLVIWAALVERDRVSVDEVCARVRAELVRRGGA